MILPDVISDLEDNKLLPSNSFTIPACNPEALKNDDTEKKIEKIEK